MEGLSGSRLSLRSLLKRSLFPAQARLQRRACMSDLTRSCPVPSAPPPGKDQAPETAGLRPLRGRGTPHGPRACRHSPNRPDVLEAASASVSAFDRLGVFAP